MIEIVNSIILVVSVWTIPLSLINLGFINDDVRIFLSYKVGKFFYALLAMLSIITLKVIFGSTLLNGIIHSSDMVRRLLTLALSLYFFAYNVGLFLTLISSRLKPRCSTEIRDLVLSSLVLYLFFKEVNYLSYYVDFISYFFLFWLVYILFRLNVYLKVSRHVVDPIDVLKPTKLFIPLKPETRIFPY